MYPNTLQLLSGCLILTYICPSTQAVGEGRVLHGPNRGVIDNLKDLDGIDTIKIWKEFPTLKFLEEAYVLYFSHLQRFPLHRQTHTLDQAQIRNHLKPAERDPNDTKKYIPRVNNDLYTTMVVGDFGGNTANVIGAAFFRWIQGDQVVFWLNRESTDTEIEDELKNKWEADIEKINKIEPSKRTAEENKKLVEPTPTIDAAAIKAEKEKRAELYQNAKNAYEPLLEIMESRGVPVFRRTGTITDTTIHAEDINFISAYRGAGIASVLEGQSGAGHDGCPLYPKVYRSSGVVKYLRETEKAKIWTADVTSFLRTFLYDTSSIKSPTLQEKLTKDKNYVIIADYTTAINGFYPQQEFELLNGVEPEYCLGVPSMIQSLIEDGKKGFEGLNVFKRKHTTYVVSPTPNLVTLLKGTPQPFFSEANFDTIKELHTGYFDIVKHDIACRT